MVLVVAVQKRRPRVIGNEINFHAAEPRLLMVSSITPDVFLSPTFVTSNVCLCSTARAARFPLGQYHSMPAPNTKSLGHLGLGASLLYAPADETAKRVEFYRRIFRGLA